MTRISKAACIGGGVIGGGWIARFRLAGIDVQVFDPHHDAQRLISEVMDNAERAYSILTKAPLPKRGNLTFCTSLEEAVKGADWIQESVPEALELKRGVLTKIDAAAEPTALIGSSTSALLATDLQRDMKHPGRMFVAHPFNPVYLLPLVELVGGTRTEKSALESAREKLPTIGMTGIIIKKEIDAFVADRLMEAFWREALWLIKDDICDTETLDDVVRYSFGLRWAQMGLFETFRIAGGAAGMRDFLTKYGPCLSWPLSKLMDVVDLDPELVEKIAAQSDVQSGDYTIRQLEYIRDQNLAGILKGLKTGDDGRGWGAGKLLADYEKYLTENNSANAAYADALPLLTKIVSPDWIDYNGHMTEYRYTQCFGEATDVLLERIGVTSAYVETGHSYYSVETHMRLLAEAKLDDVLSVKAQLLQSDGKKLRVFMTLQRGSDDVLVATYEVLMLHVSSKEGRAVPALDEVRTKLDPLLAAHAQMPTPAGAGRSITAN